MIDALYRLGRMSKRQLDEFLELGRRTRRRLAWYDAAPQARNPMGHDPNNPLVQIFQEEAAALVESVADQFEYLNLGQQGPPPESMDFGIFLPTGPWPEEAEAGLLRNPFRCLNYQPHCTCPTCEWGPVPTVPPPSPGFTQADIHRMGHTPATGPAAIPDTQLRDFVPPTRDRSRSRSPGEPI